MGAVYRARHSCCSPRGRGKAFTLSPTTGCHRMGSWRGHRAHEPGHRATTSGLTAPPGPTPQSTCGVPWTSCSLSFQSMELVQQGLSPRTLPTPPYDLNSDVLAGSVSSAGTSRPSQGQWAAGFCSYLCGIHLGPHKTVTVTRLKNFVEF